MAAGGCKRNDMNHQSLSPSHAAFCNSSSATGPVFPAFCPNKRKASYSDFLEMLITVLTSLPSLLMFLAKILMYIVEGDCFH
jgi:hypothetical protein